MICSWLGHHAGTEPLVNCTPSSRSISPSQPEKAPTKKVSTAKTETQGSQTKDLRCHTCCLLITHALPLGGCPPNNNRALPPCLLLPTSRQPAPPANGRTFCLRSAPPSPHLASSHAAVATPPSAPPLATAPDPALLATTRRRRPRWIPLDAALLATTCCRLPHSRPPPPAAAIWDVRSLS